MYPKFLPRAFAIVVFGTVLDFVCPISRLHDTCCSIILSFLITYFTFKMCWYCKMIWIFISSIFLRLKRPALDMSSKEASAILDSVHKKAKVFGCNLENYVKVSTCTKSYHAVLNDWLRKNNRTCNCFKFFWKVCVAFPQVDIGDWLFRP